jgi:pyruvate dehydrogenase E2 component (dihydrolipoamide acetyltransferase)
MGEFRMPSLGADMAAGRLVEWRVKPGDRVERGQIVAVVETEKGAIEVEIWEGGVVERVVVEAGAKVPVGTVLAAVRGDGEAVAVPKPAVVRPAAAMAVLAEGVTPAGVAANGWAPAGGHRPRVSPVAKKRAAELGLDLATVAGTGPSGAITLADVEKRARGPAAAPTPEPAPEAAGGWTPERLTALRKAIAASMARSKREIPHYYLRSELELTAASAWLETENRRRPLADRILPVALLLAATARAAKIVPETNGHFVDGVFHPAAGVHLGVAIALRGGGLVAPAIHDADRMHPPALMAALSPSRSQWRRMPSGGGGADDGDTGDSEVAP